MSKKNKWKARSVVITPLGHMILRAIDRGIYQFKGQGGDQWKDGKRLCRR